MISRGVFVALCGLVFSQLRLQVTWVLSWFQGFLEALEAAPMGGRALGHLGPSGGS